MAASLLAMNSVFGRFFEVFDVELFEPSAFAEQQGAPAFIFDVQTHYVSSHYDPMNVEEKRREAVSKSALLSLRRRIREAGLNPKLATDRGTIDDLSWRNFVKEVFLDSETSIGLISTPPGPYPQEAVVPPSEMAHIRDEVNRVAGSQRMLAHAQIYPGIGNLADPFFGDYTQWQIDNFHPDSWKGYNIAAAAKTDLDPNSLMKVWRLDDEVVAYPIYQVIANNKDERKEHPGFFNLCIHKGLSPNPPDDPEHGNPDDLEKAATDWPHFNFLIYHSCIRPGFWMLASLNEIQGGPQR